jgi:iron(III) transport system ATP-binding protein
MLRLVAGLTRAERGTIELGGVVVDDERVSLPPEKRHIGLVFQEHALFPHLSVAGNVGFGVRTGPRARAARVAEMLALVGLDGYGERYPHELSGGERQRVALARALAPAPALLLLDEPFASLDPNLRVRIREDVVSILRVAATPAVFVTHDQSEALAIGDRVAVMEAGRIVQLDTPERVFHGPVDRFVASFMGEADFMTVAEARSTLARCVVPLGLGDDDTVMTRPDDVGFELDQTGVATVSAVEFRGSSWCYVLTLGSGRTLRSVRSHLVRVPLGATVRPHLVDGHQLVAIGADRYTAVMD